ncbi:MAG: phage integrase SAM-like domain-containing protein [Prevotella sp.]|nr:phage integrase SAM-like domain-containing protein [Prevotella sp.]
MASVKIYFDRRTPKTDGTCPLKIAVSHKSATRTISTGVSLRPADWDKTQCRVVNRTDKTFLNAYMLKKRQEVEQAILRLGGAIRAMTATQLKDRIEYELTPPDEREAKAKNLLVHNFLKFANTHTQRTKEIYLTTYNHLCRYLQGAINTLTFEDVNKAWLRAFDTYLQQTCPSRNGRNLHLRNLNTLKARQAPFDVLRPNGCVAPLDYTVGLFNRALHFHRERLRLCL